MTERLNTALNFICTYEKVVTINGSIIDVIEEFDIKGNEVALHGYNNIYKFMFTNINIDVYGAHVNIDFFGDTGGSLCF